MKMPELRLISLTICVLIAPAMPRPAPSAPEYNIKAGYVLLFTRFVTWPKDAFPLPDTPIVIAVLGEDPFGNLLDETFKGADIQGRKVVIKKVRSAAEAQHSNLVFISSAESDKLSVWLDSLNRTGILSVTETGKDAPSGAVINFVKEKKHLRFDIDLRAMERVGLKISSPMLVSARKIHNVVSGEH